MFVLTIICSKNPNNWWYTGEIYIQLSIITREKNDIANDQHEFRIKHKHTSYEKTY